MKKIELAGDGEPISIKIIQNLHTDSKYLLLLRFHRAYIVPVIFFNHGGYDLQDSLNKSTSANIPEKKKKTRNFCWLKKKKDSSICRIKCWFLFWNFESKKIIPKKTGVLFCNFYGGSNKGGGE